MAKEAWSGVGRRRGQADESQGRAESGDSLVLRTLAAGMGMLGLFDAEHRDWSLDEMVVRLGVQRMTGYRMARTLQSTGHLVNDATTGAPLSRVAHERDGGAGGSGG
jgi:hypothetical protein